MIRTVRGTTCADVPRNASPLPLQFLTFATCLGLSLVWLAATTISAQDKSPEVVTQQREVLELIRSAVKYEVELKRLPALSISVVDDDKVILSEGLASTGPGVTNTSKVASDAANRRPIDGDTVYRVGSVSKLFTDIAVMQQVEQGKLKLDQPVTDVLADFAPANSFGKSITLRQLMSHRSGLVREPPVGHYFDPTEPTVSATVKSLNQTRLIYAPDTKTKYSNAGITVVGAMLEQVTGASYDREIERSILQPLGMRASGFELNDALRAKLAPCVMWTLDGRRFEAPQFKLGTAPAGNLYSTANDMAQFVRCVLASGKFGDQRLLQAATLEEMITPIKDANGKPQGFGLGFRVSELDGTKRIGHGGAVYGCATQVEMLPAERVGVSVLISLDCANGVAERLATFALRALVAHKHKRPLPVYERTQEVPVARASELIGSYVADDSRIDFHYLNRVLTMKRNAVTSVVRATDSDGALVVDDVQGFSPRIEVVDRDHLKIDGKTYTREPDRMPVAVNPEWTGLIGEYGWDHDVLTIYEDRGQLVALIEWFFAYPLRRIDANTFAFPDYGLYHGEQLQFHRDARGQATHVIAAEVRFDRRDVGTEAGQTFKIKPLRPLAELREEAMRASPPVERSQHRSSELVELVSLVPDLALDIRYATTNNFADAVFYSQPRAFLQRPAAQARYSRSGKAQTARLWAADTRRLSALVCHQDVLGRDPRLDERLCGQPGQRLASQPWLRGRSVADRFEERQADRNGIRIRRVLVAGVSRVSRRNFAAAMASRPAPQADGERRVYGL